MSVKVPHAVYRHMVEIVPTIEEFNDLAARVEALEKRLADNDPGQDEPVCSKTDIAEPGDECDGCDGVITNLDQPVHIEPHKIIKGKFISNAGLEALRDQYRRQGVEAVAKWFEHGGEARETISAGIRANLDEILKEAPNAENR